MKNPSYVTISIDDGHPTDLRTAELLEKYGLKATFYIPATNGERPVMSRAEIQQLGEQFEIGAHTMNHIALKSLDSEQARTEINDGKKWLEDLLGTAVSSFCYPRGKFDARVVAMVEEAGFAGARTCWFNVNGFPKNPFVWGVSTHASPHSPLIQVRHALLERNFAGAVNYFRVFKASRDWEVHFSHSLEYVSRNGGIAHLYLHSWEIENFGHWAKLESVFRAIDANSRLTRMSNGELYQLWKVQRESPLMFSSTNHGDGQ